MSNMFIVICIGALMLTLGVAIIVYAVTRDRSEKKINDDIQLVDAAMSKLYFGFILVNLKTDKYAVNAQLKKGEANLSELGYDKLVEEEAGRIKNEKERKEYKDKLSRHALLRAYIMGEQSVRVTYTAESARFATDAFMMENASGDIHALIIKREEKPRSEELALARILKTQKSELERVRKQRQAMVSLLEEKYVEINELEDELGNIIEAHKASGEPELEPVDIRMSIKDIVPRLRDLVEEAGCDFALRMDEEENPIVNSIVMADSIYLNALILEMVFNALKYSERPGKIIYDITQVPAPSERAEGAAENAVRKTAAAPARNAGDKAANESPDGDAGGIIGLDAEGYAYYEYSCIYLGEGLEFNSRLVHNLGGNAVVERTTDGGVAITAELRLKAV